MAQVASRYGVSKDVTPGEAFAYAMRPDELRPCLPHDEAMENAPQTDGTFFKVPKVIDR
jgi:Asp-tRNA(Asn)/Glu-tRNA(Gln) amidotransferase C subunit